MEGLISTFHIDWKLMIAQIINFVLVFLALYFLAAKPLRNLIRERTEEITTGILNGEKNKEILQNTKKEYEEIISKARNEANIIFQDGKKEANKKKNEMLENAKVEVSIMIENGKKTLEAEKSKMMIDAKREIVSMVLATTKKVIGDKIDSAYEQKVIKELNNL